VPPKVYGRNYNPYHDSFSETNLSPAEYQDNASNPFAFKGNGRIISKDYKLKIKTELCKSWVKK